jgi:hypothetical protein
MIVTHLIRGTQILELFLRFGVILVLVRMQFFR